MRKTIPSLLLVFFSAALSSHPQDRPSPPPPRVPESTSPASASIVTIDENVVYARINGSDLHLDVYKPPDTGAAARPAVVLIHGGGWSSLDKSTMHNMARLLARAGFVAFSVDYRLWQGPTGQNRWPAQLDDVQRAVRWIRANAAKYSVNPDRIGAFGHSAGAQLAALLGMEDTRDHADPALAQYSSKVQAVVDVSGPVDFTAGHDSEAPGFLSRFFGAEYAQHPEIWRDASPLFHVAKDNAPFLIVHGTQDQDVAVAQAQEFSEKLQAAGVPVTLIKLNDAHTFQTPEARRQLALETLTFFNRYLFAPH